ncbi:hypothetical protein Efla_004033 [Eimeria flavescens]
MCRIYQSDVCGMQHEVREASADGLLRIGEIRDLLIDYTSATLVLRPNDIFQFAYEYFSAFLEPQYGAVAGWLCGRLSPQRARSVS